MTPGPALPLPLPRHCRILGKAVARLGSCCGLGSCLFQIKKAASERARCFAQIAKRPCAAAPPVQIILNFKFSRADSAMPPLPSQRGAAARPWERRGGSSGRSRGGEGGRSESLSTCASSHPALPKIPRAGEECGPCEALAAPTEGTAFQWQRFCVLVWIKSKQQRDIVCPCSTGWASLEKFHYDFFLT